ncbi:3 beta-hydroxysteroid dehydrogenase type 7 [Phlyctochytrium bullatum]|nr:3 beta-hydroxysteroid dehydrogenase type 7 [Phlyctochytrium bullatum]
MDLLPPGLVAVFVAAVAVLVAWFLTGRYPPATPSTKGRSASRNVKETAGPAAVSTVPAANVPIAIVGGAGFVGRYVAEALIARGEKAVFLMDVAAPPTGFLRQGMEYVKVDITDPESLKNAFRKNKIKIVFQTAAIITHMHHLEFQEPLSMKINYKGTQNVVEACLATGVSVLAYTSTSHVMLGYDQFHIDNGNEETPYAKRPLNFYGKSKALAEKAVREANGSVGPTGVKFHNLAYALSLLEHAVRTRPDEISGEVFCLSEEEPVSGPEFYNILRKYEPSLKPCFTPLSFFTWSLAFASSANQYIFQGKNSLGELDALTIASYQTMMASYTFSSAKIKRVLGYKPLYSLEEGIQKGLALHIKQKLK